MIVRLRAWSSIAGIAAVAVMHAWSAPVIQAQQSLYDGLAPGEFFDMVLVLENPDPITIVAYDFFVQASSANSFLLDEQSFSAPVNRPNYSRALPFSINASIDNFGAFNNTFSEGFSQGTFVLQTLTLQVDPFATAGNYTILFGWNQPSPTGGPSLLDSSANEYQMPAPILINVNVVPEPGTLGLLALAALVPLARSWRMRRHSGRGY